MSQKDRLRSAPEGTTGWEGENEQSDSKWCAMKKKQTSVEKGDGLLFSSEKTHDMSSCSQFGQIGFSFIL